MQKCVKNVWEIVKRGVEVNLEPVNAAWFSKTRSFSSGEGELLSGVSTGNCHMRTKANFLFKMQKENRLFWNMNRVVVMINVVSRTE